MNDILDQRVGLFCFSVVTSLDQECDARVLPQTKAKYFVLFADGLKTAYMKWLNEHSQLKRESRSKLNLADMYRMISVFLISHCIGLRIDKSISVLHDMGCSLPPLSTVIFIIYNIIFHQ